MSITPLLRRYDFRRDFFHRVKRQSVLLKRARIALIYCEVRMVSSHENALLLHHVASFLEPYIRATPMAPMPSNDAYGRRHP